MPLNAPPNAPQPYAAPAITELNATEVAQIVPRLTVEMPPVPRPQPGSADLPQIETVTVAPNQPPSPRMMTTAPAVETTARMENAAPRAAISPIRQVIALVEPPVPTNTHRPPMTQFPASCSL